MKTLGAVLCASFVLTFATSATARNLSERQARQKAVALLKDGGVYGRTCGPHDLLPAIFAIPDTNVEEIRAAIRWAICKGAAPRIGDSFGSDPAGMPLARF